LISKDEKEKLWQKIVEHPANDFQETVDASQFSQIQDHFKQSLQDYQKLGREISNELKSLIEEEKKLQKYKKALEKGESELDSHTKKAEQLEKQFNESNIAYTLAMSNVERLKKDIPSQYLMKGVLEEEIQATDKKIQTLEKRMEKAQQSFDQKKLQLNTLHTQIQSSQKNIEQLALKVEKQREIFNQELSKYDFETVEAYQKARLDEETISEQRKALETFNTLYTEKTSRLSSLNEELKGKTKPDVELLEKQLTTLNTALDQLKEKRVMLQNRLSENTKRLDKIKTLYEKKQTLENQYGVHGYLWDLTKGANAYRINFERFVQTSFLDDILFAANQKLEGMTDGRYQLNRITETDNKKSTSGLDIEVFDQYTGEARHVKTLSGGEGFKASLAMALGLSEVVQSHSGGVSLETLFIDEGFGSLDSESLDNAIKTLMELQSGGRLVGIISHVAELKERIDTYLEVTSTKDGSYTQFFVP
jgi:exonuclease SbcC